MKNHKEKVVAAIAGAITMYLQAEQEARLAVEAPQEELFQVLAPAKPVAIPSLWAISGRQAAMEMRRFLQMRLIK
ncbi:MAG: hypothetical protein WHS38_10910 [Thermodesulforhabdaceae bacterium]